MWNRDDEFDTTNLNKDVGRTDETLYNLLVSSAAVPENNNDSSSPDENESKIIWGVDMTPPVPDHQPLDFLLKPLIERAHTIINHVMVYREDDSEYFNENCDHYGDAAFAKPLILDSYKLVSAAKAFHQTRLRNMTKLSDFRDYLLLFFPELNGQSSLITCHMIKKYMQRQLVALMIMTKDDVASFIAAKYLCGAQEVRRTPKIVLSRSKRRRGNLDETRHSARWEDQWEPNTNINTITRENTNLRTNPRDRSTREISFKENRSQSQESVSEYEDFIDPASADDTVFENLQIRGGIIQYGHSEFKKLPNSCITKDTSSEILRENILYGYVNENEQSIYQITELTIIIVDTDSIRITDEFPEDFIKYAKPIPIGFLCTNYNKGFLVKFFDCSKLGHDIARYQALEYFKPRRSRGRPSNKTRAKKISRVLPRQLNNNNNNNNNKSSTISRGGGGISSGYTQQSSKQASSLSKYELSRNRIERLKSKALEFPYVHGIRFEPETFSWISTVNDETRKFLVKKHGWEKSRMWAIQKVEEWKRNADHDELNIHLEEEIKIKKKIEQDPNFDLINYLDNQINDDKLSNDNDHDNYHPSTSSGIIYDPYSIPISDLQEQNDENSKSQ